MTSAFDQLETRIIEIIQEMQDEVANEMRIIHQNSMGEIFAVHTLEGLLTRLQSACAAAAQAEALSMSLSAIRFARKQDTTEN